MKIIELVESYYEIRISKKKLIQNIDDQVFLITDKDNKKYKFKIINDPTSIKENQLEIITDWIQYLDDNLETTFPKAIKSKIGKYSFEVNENQQRKTGVLYEWLDWPVIDRYTEKNMEKLGALLGEIHKFTEKYHIRSQRVKTVNKNWIIDDALKAFENSEIFINLTKNERSRLIENLHRLGEFLESQKYERSTFGLIHSDIHRNNIVKESKGVSLIDFDDSLMGHYLLDMGVLLNEFADDPDNYEELKTALLRGYRSRRECQLTEQDLEMFRKIGDVLYAEWIINLLKEDKEVNQKKVEYSKEAIERIIALI